MNRVGYFIGAVAATIVGWFIVQRVERVSLLERERWQADLHAELERIPTFVRAEDEACCGQCDRGCWS